MPVDADFPRTTRWSRSADLLLVDRDCDDQRSCGMALVSLCAASALDGRRAALTAGLHWGGPVIKAGIGVVPVEPGGVRRAERQQWSGAVQDRDLQNRWFAIVTLTRPHSKIR
jgi:hypothetical protein